VKRFRMPLGLFASLLLPLQAAAQEFFSNSPISGDPVPVTVTISGDETASEVSVSIPPGSGDLLGFFANCSDERALARAEVDDPSDVVSLAEFRANAVVQVGNGNNVRPARDWDVGLRFGRAGSGQGPLTQVSFALLGLSPQMLTTAPNQGLLFGVRIQSTSGAQGSAKIGLAESVSPPPPPPLMVEITQPRPGPLVGDTVVISGIVTNAESVTIQIVDAFDSSVIAGPVQAGISGDIFVSPPLLIGGDQLLVVATATRGTLSRSDTVVVQPGGGSD
jgi:hypothetical protein